MEHSVPAWTAGLALFFVAGGVAVCEDTPADGLLRDTEANANHQEVHAQVLQAQPPPLNRATSHQPVTGQATARTETGRFTVQVDARGWSRPPPQHIHGKAELERGSCPDMSADEDGDRIIDVVEGVPDYGAIRLTLDDDLSDGPATQANNLPNPDNQVGATTYMSSASADPVENGADDTTPSEANCGMSRDDALIDA